MLSGTRLARIVNKISEKIFKSGRAPTQKEIQAEIRGKRQDILDSSKPSMLFRPFEFRSRFDIDKFNTMMLEIDDDVEYLFEEHVAQAVRLLKMLNQSEINFRGLDRRLRVVDSIIQDFVMTSKNAAALLFAVSDSLIDARNLDLRQTTAALDFSAGVATLSPTAGGVKRLQVPHLDVLESWPITILDAENKVISEISGSQKPIAGVTPIASHVSPFGYSFGDLLNAWQFVVNRDKVEPTSIQFTIPLVPQDSRIPEVSIGRIDIDPSVSSPTQFEILHSLDSVNFTRFDGHETPFIIDTPETLRFPQTLVQYLRITMSKNRPDELLDNGGAAYTFGLKNLSFFTMGYSPESQLVTTALEPQDSDSLPAVHQVTLSADDVVPDGTDIIYSVALDETTPQFREIANIQRDTSGAPQIVTFAGTFDSPRNENRFSVTTTPPIHQSRNGINLYRIYNSVKSGHQFRTARLYRGIGGWHKQRITDFVDKTVTNEIKFDRDDNRPLYLRQESEDANIISVVSGSETIVEVAHEILGGMSNTPAHGPTGARTPNYSIETVQHHPADVTVSGVTGEPISATEFLLEIPSSLSLKSGDVVTVTGITVPLVNVQLVRDATISLSTTRLVINISSLVASSSIASFTGGVLQVVRRDVTAFVQSFNGAHINLASRLTTSSDDRFAVTYHRGFGPEHVLDTAGILVTDSGSKVYAPGIDYILDVIQSTITRIPTGEIPESGTVDISIPYRETVTGLEIYTTFVRVGETLNLRLNSVSLDRDAGESATIIVDGKVEDFADQGLPKLVPGIYQIRVQSHAIKDSLGVVNQSSAIFKIINMSTVSNKFLFAAERFFQTQDAFIEPMQQTSITKLSSKVRKTDRRFFAIDGSDVIINFDPTKSDEILYLTPGKTTVDTRENYDLYYRYTPTTPATNKVIVKAILRRDIDKPDSTPIIRSFSLRFA